MCVQKNFLYTNWSFLLFLSEISLFLFKNPLTGIFYLSVIKLLNTALKELITSELREESRKISRARSTRLNMKIFSEQGGTAK